jgi:hypothetical protein
MNKLIDKIYTEKNKEQVRVINKTIENALSLIKALEIIILILFLIGIILTFYILIDDLLFLALGGSKFIVILIIWFNLGALSLFIHFGMIILNQLNSLILVNAIVEDQKDDLKKD